uniref:Lid2 complex component lid2 n=1 Tax=Anthurium amnicola TaxID=1678845 RepID=A0A1D1ZH11_9ARAE
MTNICQKCGVSGFEECLIYCKSCQTSVEHRYCLDKTPKVTESEVHWLCEQCNSRVLKYDTFGNTSDRRGGKQWALRYRDRQSSHADLQRIKKSHLRSTSTVVGRSQNVDKSLSDTSHYWDKDVLDVVLSSKESKSSINIQGDLLSTSEKNSLHLGRESCELLGSEVAEVKKVNRRRKLILNADFDEDVPSLMPIDNFTDDVPRRSSTQASKPFAPLSSPQNCGSRTAQSDASLPEAAAERFHHFTVSPVIHPVWRGYFYVCDREYGPVVAHLANRACEKVRNVAEVLPEVLHFERLLRLDAWPRSFECSGPTDFDIALYFFPGDVRAKAVLGQLLDDVIQKDLALKAIVDKAELLVFSSMLLPQRCHVFEDGYYLWGVFRAQQAPRPRVPSNHCSRLSEVVGSVEDYQNYNALKKLSANHCSSVNGGVGNGNENLFWGSQDPSCRVPDSQFPISNDVNEFTGEDEGPLLRRQTSRPCLSPDRFCSVPKVANSPVRENFEGNVRFNFSGDYQGDLDGSLAACMELFPLQVEDLGIVTQVRGSGEVDLSLGLEPVKKRNYERKPTMGEHSFVLFGREIF